MPKSFDLPVSHDDEPYVINPFAVTFIRRQYLKRAEHAPGCTEDLFCPIAHPEETGKPNMRTCRWSEPEEGTEVCFMNSAGAQSSVLSTLSKRDVKNLLDEALRYNI